MYCWWLTSHTIHPLFSNLASSPCIVIERRLHNSHLKLLLRLKILDLYQSPTEIWSQMCSLPRFPACQNLALLLCSWEWCHILTSTNFGSDMFTFNLFICRILSFAYKTLILILLIIAIYLQLMLAAFDRTVCSTATLLNCPTLSQSLCSIVWHNVHFLFPTPRAVEERHMPVITNIFWE